MAEPARQPPASAARGRAAWLALLLLASLRATSCRRRPRTRSRASPWCDPWSSAGALDIDPLRRDDRRTWRVSAGTSTATRRPGSVAAGGARRTRSTAAIAARCTGAPGPAFTRESQLRGHAGAGAQIGCFFNPAFRRGGLRVQPGHQRAGGRGAGRCCSSCCSPLGRGAARGRWLRRLALGAGLADLRVQHHVLRARAGRRCAVRGLRRCSIARLVAAAGRWPRAAVAAGLLAGVAVLVELPAALGAVAAGGLTWLHSRRAPAAACGCARLALFVAGAAAAAAGAGGVPDAPRSGARCPRGYAHVGQPDLRRRHVARACWACGWPRPAVLLARCSSGARAACFTSRRCCCWPSWGWCRGRARPRRPRRAARWRRRWCWRCSLLLNAGYYMWWGGAALGPRHVIPALPFLCSGIWPALAPGASAWRGGCSLPCCWRSRWPTSWRAVAVSPLAAPDVDLLFEHSYPRLLRGQVAHPSRAATNLGLLLGLPRAGQPVAAAGAVGARAWRPSWRPGGRRIAARGSPRLRRAVTPAPRDPAPACCPGRWLAAGRAGPWAAACASGSSTTIAGPCSTTRSSAIAGNLPRLLGPRVCPRRACPTPAGR